MDDTTTPAAIYYQHDGQNITSSAQTQYRDAHSTEAAFLMMIPAPTDKDIISGRGRVIDQHPGNKVFRRFIEEAADEYNHANTPRASKPLISNLVRRQLENEGMRFIKRDNKNCAWRELISSEIKLKIGHALRDCNHHNLSRVSGSSKSPRRRYTGNGGLLPKHNGRMDSPVCITVARSASSRRDSGEVSVLADDEQQEDHDLFSIVSKDSRNIGGVDAWAALSFDQQDEWHDSKYDIHPLATISLLSPNNFYAVDPDALDPLPFAPSILGTRKEENEQHASDTLLPVAWSKESHDDHVAERNQQLQHSGLIDVLVKMCAVDDLLLSLLDTSDSGCTTGTCSP